MNESDRRVIAIGGSAGAIGAVRELCASLPSDLPAALCIVIHIGARGGGRIADIFGKCCPIPIITAADGQRVESGRGYVAAADHHLLVMDGVVRLGRGPRENLARPAIDPLFRSIGVSCGSRAVGVVLTGMLNDGAAGLADLKRCGGLTVVQNPAEATAPDMPLEALRASDIDYRAHLAELGSLLDMLVRKAPPPSPPPPEDVRFEVDIALGRPVGTGETVRLGDPAALSCPACGGVLSQIRRSPPLRFRCQVGHGYTAETLASEQEGSVDEALRVALRILEERAVLTEKMAEEARRSGLQFSAASYEQRSRESRTQVKTLRKALRKAEEEREPSGV